MIEPARILFIDDEERFLEEKREFLQGENYQIYTATDGEKALSLLAQGGFAVIVSDLRMKPLSGTEILARAAVISPDTVRIILAGHHRLEEVFQTINAGHVWKYIQKPIEAIDLKTTLSRAVQQWQLVVDNKKLKEQLTDNNIRLESLVVERTRELSARDRVMEYLLKARELKEAVDFISKTLAETWGLEYIAVHLNIAGSLVPVSLWGGGDETLELLKFWAADESDPLQTAFSTGENLRPLPDQLNDSRREFFSSAPVLFLPMRKDSDCLGVIEAANMRSKTAVSTEQENILAAFIKFYNLAAKDHLLQSNLIDIEKRLDSIIKDLV